jgi:hypothetical protein
LNVTRTPMQEFAGKTFNKLRAWWRRIRRMSGEPPTARTLVELGQLLPTLPREYFASTVELPFQSRRELDLSTAWWCAEAAMLAYQEPQRIAELASAVITEGWEVQLFGHDQPTLAVLLKSRDAAILAFRGTRVNGFERLDTVFTRPWLDYADVKADAQFVPAAFAPEGSVHGGILESLERFWKRHGTEVTQATGDVPLFLTGHSLGAAVATLVAAGKRFESATAVYTFGSPRVGDSKFRDLIAGRGLAVHRFVHGSDLVTTLAPEGLFGFTHASDILHIKPDGSGIDTEEPDLAGVLMNALKQADVSIRSAILNFTENRLLNPHRLLVPKGALADHAPVFYVDRIRELARKSIGTS